MTFGGAYEARQLTLGMHVLRGFGTHEADDDGQIPTALPHTPQMYYAKRFSRSVEVRAVLYAFCAADAVCVDGRCLSSAAATSWCLQPWRAARGGLQFVSTRTMRLRSSGPRTDQ